MIQSISSRTVWFVVIVIYMVGLAGFMIPALNELFVWLIPINILFAFSVLLLGEERISISKILLFLICFLFGFFYELAGTKTGIIFGEYAYGEGLGLKIWDVPLLIGLNWFFMVYTSLILVGKYVESKVVKAFLAPVLMVAYDFLLEPFAMENDMWNWAGDIIPLQNYVAWYAGGLFLCLLTVFGKFELKNRFAAGLYVVQFMFFGILFIRRLLLE